MILTSPPDMPWLEMEFWCSHCGGGFRIEMGDLGAAVRTPPELVEGAWSVRMSCPYCRQAGFPRTKEDA